DLVPQVRRPEGVDEGGEHAHGRPSQAPMITTAPPADSIFSRAVAETACACTSSFAVRSPSPSTLIFASFPTRPLAASVSGETLPSAAYADRRPTLTATNGERNRFLTPR